MGLIGTFATCSICGKKKVIATERRKVLLKQSRIDFYQECKDCNAIPLWDKRLKSKKILD